MEHRKLTATYPEDGEFSYYLDRIFLREGLLVEATRCFAYRNTIRELIGRPRFQMALKRDLKAHGKTEYAALCEIPAYRLRALNLPKDLNLSRYNPDYSVFAMEGERLVGMLLVRNLEEHWLNLDYLENRGTNPAVTISLLCAGCMALLKNVQQGKQNPEDELTFQNFGQNGLDFATRFLKIDPKKVNWYHIISTREDSYGW